jgi:hypothetical protein
MSTDTREEKRERVNEGVYFTVEVQHVVRVYSRENGVVITARLQVVILKTQARRRRAVRLLARLLTPKERGSKRNHKERQKRRRESVYIYVCVIRSSLRAARMYRMQGDILYLF